MTPETNDTDRNSGLHRFVFNNFKIDQLTEIEIVQKSIQRDFFDPRQLQSIDPIHITINEGSFTTDGDFPVVTCNQTERQILVSCTCHSDQGKLCEHEALVLTAIIRRDELNVFFHDRARHVRLKKYATDYGIENERDLDTYFLLHYEDGKLSVQPKLPGLIALTKEHLHDLQKEILIKDASAEKQGPLKIEEAFSIVFRKHKFYAHFVIEVYKSQKTREGRLKNPLALVNAADLVWQSENPDHIKFFSALTKFQNHTTEKRSQSDIHALKAILKNPLSYGFYIQNEQYTVNLTASSLIPVDIKLLSQELLLSVDHSVPFYKISGELEIGGTYYQLKDLALKFSYFLFVKDILYLVDKLDVLATIDLFNKTKEDLLVHTSKYASFRNGLLKGLEDKITVRYNHVQAASSTQIEENGFDATPSRHIYLTDFGNYVMLTPVMTYGNVEIPIRSKRLIYAEDPAGKEFRVERDDEAEINFIALITKQHENFKEQGDDDMSYFCLHKKQFLNEDWFLNVFDEWLNHGIGVHGFNKIEELKLNPNKIKISIKIVSGINWFNAIVDARFGTKKTSLNLIQKAIRKKSKYIQLDDGSFGILPQQWIERFSEYFKAAEILDDHTFQISKTNFASLDDLFEENMLDAEVKKEISMYREKLNDFTSIRPVKISKHLKAKLRPYQQLGLNWLNFLDDFNFGGCLADDMGLGKSIQIIAFILSQKEKSGPLTNLLIVPTTLIFNWQAEIMKFAPTIKIYTLYGTERQKSKKNLENYDVVLTSYTTMMSDIFFLKEFSFNYIFLDESQAIKNPETQRYKAATLLKARNKIVITGTPIENNTFDLYGQFSFACPGLLGNKRYFREVYAMPIDKFKNSKRARELQSKIQPFLLRRTKEQVASELPDKQETILYCEMKEEQLSIYKAYEKEFRDYIAAIDSDELKKSSMNVLKGLTKLRQICDSPALMPDGNLTMKEPSAKIQMLLEQLESKAPHHKILVFSQFVGMLDLIRKELEEKKIRFSYLTGSTRNRQAIVNEFQDNPEVRVFLISLKAGGTGLNLTEADCVYLVDPWWNPAVENQAIDRSHRIGQYKKVQAIRLISPATVEEKMMVMQESKKALAGDLIKTDTSFMKSLSKEDLLGLFS